MRLVLVLLICPWAAALRLTSEVGVSAASASQLAVKSVHRRALFAGAASMMPLFAVGKANAITDYAKKDFKDEVYIGPSVVGAAPTYEGEQKLEELYKAALTKQEQTVKAMGFDMDDSDKLELEMLVRTQYCGFQAKLKCKGSPAAKGGQGSK